LNVLAYTPLSDSVTPPVIHGYKIGSGECTGAGCHGYTYMLEGLF